MFLDDARGRFEEGPEHKAKQSIFRSPLLIKKIIERLLHGFSQVLSESTWIKGEEPLIEAANSALLIHHKQMFLEIVFAAGRS